MISCASRPQDVFRGKTTQAHISPKPEHFYSRNAGLNTTSTPSLNVLDQSLLRSFLLSPTHLAFLHLHSPKQVLVPQYSNFALEKAPSHTHVCKPLQRLFRPYSKPTPYLHSCPHLCLNNPYYKIRSTFDISTNLQLHCLHKPTFRHCHN